MAFYVKSSDFPEAAKTKVKSLINVVLITIILAGCENEWQIVSGDMLSERDGIYYESGSNVPFTGRADWFHDNGQLQTYIYYKGGQRNGINEDFFEDGTLSERSVYIDGKRNGLHEEYYPNGQLMERRHYIYGKGNGLWERYGEDGTLETSNYYIDGAAMPVQAAPY